MKKWTKFQTKAQKCSKVHFIREIWCSNREIGRFDEKLGDSRETGRVGRYVVCSRDPIIAGFMEKCFRFKTRKCRRQFVFSRRCHQWVSGAIVVVMSETTSINIIFAYSQRLGFHYFTCPIAIERVIVALLRLFHRVVVEEIYTSVFCDIAIYSELTIFAFFSLLTVVFLAL